MTTITVATIEADVVATIAKIKTGIVTLETELQTAVTWIAGEVPAIVTAIETAIGFANSVGLSANPEVATAITAANIAVAGLNAFETANTAGQTDTAAVVAGYTAVKNAVAAVATAASTTASTTPVAA